MRYYNYDIVFQEVPDEVSLAINLTNCPNHCEGCHSPHLWEDTGTPLDEAELEQLAQKYTGSITCVCLMGGDRERGEVERLAKFIKTRLSLKAAWYSGRNEMPTASEAFDYVKLGPYMPSKGSLKDRTTNQRMYRRESDGWKDITERFWR